MGGNDHRSAARERRFRLRPAFSRRRGGPYRRRAPARKEERAFASRQGDPIAGRAPGIDAMSIVLKPTLAAPRFDALPPLPLYIHLPCGLQKCPYFDFNSHEG